MTLQVTQNAAKNVIVSTIVQTAVTVYCVVQSTTTALSGGSSDDDDGCFPGDSRILHQEKGYMFMANASVGDNILSVHTQSGKSTGLFSDIVYLPHLQNNKFESFIKIDLENGMSLRLTKNHLIPVVGGCEAGSFITTTALIKASAVSGGDCVFVVKNDGKNSISCSTY